MNAALSFEDRLEIDRWRNHIKICGFGGIVVHEREESDPPEIESFAAFYRPGKLWSEFGLARCGREVLVWYSKGGADLGRFASISDAIASVLAVTAHNSLRKQTTPKSRRPRKGAVANFG